MPPVPSYSDHEVVAAFNSCLDLSKYKALPQAIKSRFCTLLRAHRVKPVCFMPECGLGLRVFSDAAVVGQLEFGKGSGDEVAIKSTHYGKFKVDDEGEWMRCPPSLYTDKTTKEPEAWIVMNDTGTKFLEDENEEDNDEDGADSTTVPDWTNVRAKALNWRDKRTAEAVAARHKGIVVKKS